MLTAPGTDTAPTPLIMLTGEGPCFLPSPIEFYLSFPAPACTQGLSSGRADRGAAQEQEGAAISSSKLMVHK